MLHEIVTLRSGVTTVPGWLLIRIASDCSPKNYWILRRNGSQTLKISEFDKACVKTRGRFSPTIGADIDQAPNQPPICRRNDWNGSGAIERPVKNDEGLIRFSMILFVRFPESARLRANRL